MSSDKCRVRQCGCVLYPEDVQGTRTRNCPTRSCASQAAATMGRKLNTATKMTLFDADRSFWQLFALGISSCSAKVYVPHAAHHAGCSADVAVRTRLTKSRDHRLLVVRTIMFPAIIHWHLRHHCECGLPGCRIYLVHAADRWMKAQDTIGFTCRRNFTGRSQHDPQMSCPQPRSLVMIWHIYRDCSLLRGEGEMLQDPLRHITSSITAL